LTFKSVESLFQVRRAATEFLDQTVIAKRVAPSVDYPANASPWNCLEFFNGVLRYVVSDGRSENSHRYGMVRTA
jgi:hypothetical protein